MSADVIELKKKTLEQLREWSDLKMPAICSCCGRVLPWELPVGAPRTYTCDECRKSAA